MQRIDRYGVVALLFLIVTFAAVVIWGEGGDSAFQGRFREREVAALPVKELKGARAEPPAGEPAPTRQAARAPRAVELEPAAPGAGTERNAGSERGRRTPAQTELPLAEAPAEDAGRSGRANRTLRAADALAAAEAERAAPSDAGPDLEPEVKPVAKPAKAGGAQAAPSSGGSRYVVQKGDTLSEIAERELGRSARWNEIVALNPGLDPKRLWVGQALAMPGASAATGSAPVASSAPAAKSAPVEKLVSKTTAAPAKSGSSYVVKKGDTLSGIAERELGDGTLWRAIAELNPGLDPKRLFVGAKLALPGAALPKSSVQVASVQQARRSNIQ